MKSKKLPTNNLTWESSILSLCTNPKKPTKTALKLIEADILTIKDLIWVLPLRVIQLPRVQSFEKIEIDSYFKGKGKIVNIDLSPAFGKRGKNKIQLFNATVVVKDTLSQNFLSLKWFNAYPNLKTQLENLDEFSFLGVVNDFKGITQIINPTIDPKEESNNLLIEYPTFNTISGNLLKKFIQKIPNSVWETPINYFSEDLTLAVGSQNLNKTFHTLHGLGDYQVSLYEEAKMKLVYFEFLKDQLKVVARKMAFKNKKSPVIQFETKKVEEFINSFPYKLTSDQDKVYQEILKDFQSLTPMMRIVQGDVGCGKTTIAQIASFIIASQNGQVAIMCPTETLARQHFKSFKVLLQNKVQIDLLVGSSKAKDRKEIIEKLKSGETKIIIGTHSLFQDSIEFKKLQLAIIDEQHKFGVEQRLKLVSKGQGCHCLLMSATPIPRTLQLAQYGDLDISTIKTVPGGRKGTQTRIVKEDTYEKYLSFIKTRIELGEQIYIVVPAITDSETLDLKNVEQLLTQYKKYFPSFKISALHGALKPEIKNKVMHNFEAGLINILISTSVIEVGINVLNSTVMAIYNPDRFGLSSLHQLRGRVGRGTKPGFCFLIPDKKASQQALKRLRVVEKSHDGFEIAEADLINRGEGDLFGTNQSGNINNKKIASIFEHLEIFQKVQQDIEQIKHTNPDLFDPLIEELLLDKKITSTV